MNKKSTIIRGLGQILLCLALVIVGIAQFAIVGHAEGTSQTVTTVTDLKAAMGNNTVENVVIGADLTLNEEIAVVGNKTLKDDGTVRTITVADTYKGVIFSVKDNAQLTIQEQKSDGLILDGNRQDATILIIGNNGAVIMNGGTIKNFSTKSYQDENDNTVYKTAIIVNKGTFTINGGIISDNIGSGTPGAILVDGGNLTITDGTIRNNQASSSGGAVMTLNGATVSISGGTFSDNHTEGPHGGGGALFVSGKLKMTGGTFKGNHANGIEACGGAIYIMGDSPYTMGRVSSISGGNFSGNTAGHLGGALYVDEYGRVKVQNAVITNNTATKFGGGLYLCPTGEGVYSSETTVNYSMITYISNNKAGKAGSDIYSEGKKPVYSTSRLLTISGFNHSLFKDVETKRYKSGDSPLAKDSYYTKTNQTCALHTEGGSKPDSPMLLFDGNKAGVIVSTNEQGVSVENVTNNGYGGAIANNGLMSDVGDLVIKKTVSGDASSQTDFFNFTVTLKDASNKPITGTYDGVTFGEGGIAKIKLTGEESNNIKYIRALPAGTQYIVEETDSKGYISTITEGQTTGIIGVGEASTIIFNNHKDFTPTTLDLSAEKTVNGGIPAKDEKFNFHLEATTAPAGASITAQDKQNSGEAITFDKLNLTKVGDYVFTITETGTSANYILDKAKYTVSVKVTVNDKNQLVYDDVVYTKNGTETIDSKKVIFDNQTTKVIIKKTDINGTKEIGGAKLTVTDINNGNSEVDSWTSVTGESHQINGQNKKTPLIAGHTYRLTEVTAPDGYTKAESIDFTIDENGKVKIGDNESPDSVIQMKDDYAQVTISKQDITSKQEIAGALLTVNDKENQKVVDSWTSKADESHQINGNNINTPLIAGHTYILTETTAPNGYTKAESIDFKIDEYGKVFVGGTEKTDKTVTMYDAPTTPTTPTTAIAGVKTWDDNNNQFGVRPESIVVYATGSDGSYTNQTVRPDASGNWTYSFADLPTADQNGKAITYTISEGAVKYYTASNTTGYNLTNKLDAPYSLTLNKKGDNGNLIPGAVYALYRKSDSGTADVKIGEYTTGNNGSVTASGLLSGSYYLKEVSAPNGYLVDPGTTDVVVADGTVQTKDSVSVNVTDAAMKLYISKQDVSNGKELSGAKLTITDTVTNKVVTEWVSDASVKTVDTSDFVADRVYVLTETKAPDGYNVAESIQFKIGADSKGQSMVSVLNNGQWTAVDNQTVIMKDAASGNPGNPTGSNPSAPNVSPSAANPTGSNPSAPNLSPNNGGNTSTTAPNANASTMAGSGAGTGTNNGSGSNGSGSNGSGSGSSSGNANTGVNGDSLPVAAAALCALGALVISATYKRKHDK